MPSIRNLAEVTAAIRSRNEEFSVRALHILLVAAGQPGISRLDLTRSIRMEPAVVGRHEYSLVKMGLLQALPNPKEPKGKVYYLTSEGEAFVASLLAILRKEY